MRSRKRRNRRKTGILPEGYKINASPKLDTPQRQNILNSHGNEVEVVNSTIRSDESTPPQGRKSINRNRRSKLYERFDDNFEVSSNEKTDTSLFQKFQSNNNTFHEDLDKDMFFETFSVSPTKSQTIQQRRKTITPGKLKNIQEDEIEALASGSIRSDYSIESIDSNNVVMDGTFNLSPGEFSPSEIDSSPNLEARPLKSCVSAKGTGRKRKNVSFGSPSAAEFCKNVPVRDSVKRLPKRKAAKFSFVEDKGFDALEFEAMADVKSPKRNRISTGADVEEYIDEEEANEIPYSPVFSVGKPGDVDSVKKSLQDDFKSVVETANAFESENPAPVESQSTNHEEVIHSELIPGSFNWSQELNEKGEPEEIEELSIKSTKEVITTSEPLNKLKRNSLPSFSSGDGTIESHEEDIMVEVPNKSFQEKQSLGDSLENDFEEETPREPAKRSPILFSTLKDIPRENKCKRIMNTDRDPGISRLESEVSFPSLNIDDQFATLEQQPSEVNETEKIEFPQPQSNTTGTKITEEGALGSSIANRVVSDVVEEVADTHLKVTDTLSSLVSKPSFPTLESGTHSSDLQNVVLANKKGEESNQERKQGTPDKPNDNKHGESLFITIGEEMETVREAGIPENNSTNSMVQHAEARSKQSCEAEKSLSEAEIAVSESPENEEVIVPVAAVIGNNPVTEKARVALPESLSNVFSNEYCHRQEQKALVEKETQTLKHQIVKLIEVSDENILSTLQVKLPHFLVDKVRKTLKRSSIYNAQLVHNFRYAIYMRVKRGKVLCLKFVQRGQKYNIAECLHPSESDYYVSERPWAYQAFFDLLWAAAIRTVQQCMFKDNDLDKVAAHLHKISQALSTCWNRLFNSDVADFGVFAFALDLADSNRPGLAVYCAQLDTLRLCYKVVKIDVQFCFFSGTFVYNTDVWYKLGLEGSTVTAEICRPLVADTKVEVLRDGCTATADGEMNFNPYDIYKINHRRLTEGLDSVYGLLKE
eukprot:augustus_masked-scaffold_8-processed-gene-7.4-mRNA-1 protein AED:1.00 eAED:1.00 QI:0/-1/0/0/-1/1/1/0/989